MWGNKYWVLFLNLEAKSFLSQITPVHIPAKGKVGLKIAHRAQRQTLAGALAMQGAGEQGRGAKACWQGPC